MLVLLIVFMVAAPLLTVGMPVDLPQTQGEPLGNEAEPLSVTIGADGKIMLQEDEVDARRACVRRSRRSCSRTREAHHPARQPRRRLRHRRAGPRPLKKAGSRHVALETKALEESDS